jgi:photosystem II stability/assembly factor-like uncharacterized protein
MGRTKRNIQSALQVAAALAWMCAAAVPTPAQMWKSMGPPGGDVRALALDPSDPRLVYMGTTDGHIFGSRDGGVTWQILGRAGARLDAVVTSIFVDPQKPQVLYASTWTRGTGGEGGGVFRSSDAGRTWQILGLAGHAVRALAAAPSDPSVLVVGALDGIYRSKDAGATWERISPEGDEELRNLDSLAIDPLNSDTIYAGTFHLPWKTTDGGKRWFPIHAGMIDDSDVLSLVADTAHPRRVYASACSGIYRSENGGAVWKKIQGIPFSARRTYVIRLDPSHSGTVYAGTSEGLWKTGDGGAVWRRITPRDWVIDAVVVEPPSDLAPEGRLVIGTEQLGALVSEDGGKNFRAANTGFYHRQIVSLALDREHPGRVLAILANAPEPVLVTDDGGLVWAPLGPGLSTEGLRRVYASPGGWYASLERGGLMHYDDDKGAWVRAGSLIGEEPAPSAPQSNGLKERKDRRRPATKSHIFDLLVNDMAFAQEIWFAATEEGLFASRDQGASWSLFSFAPLALPVSSVRVSSNGRQLRVVSLRGMVFSQDGGQSWSWHDLPFEAGGALRLDAADDTTLLATAHKGLYISRDAGRSWEPEASGLPEAPLQDLALAGDVWLASMQTGGLFLSSDHGANWSRIEGTLAEGFFPVVATGDSPGVVYAASTTEGLYAVELLTRPSANLSSSGR